MEIGWIGCIEDKISKMFILFKEDLEFLIVFFVGIVFVILLLWIFLFVIGVGLIIVVSLIIFLVVKFFGWDKWKEKFIDEEYRRCFLFIKGLICKEFEIN